MGLSRDDMKEAKNKYTQVTKRITFLKNKFTSGELTEQNY